MDQLQTMITSSIHAVLPSLEDAITGKVAKSLHAQGTQSTKAISVGPISPPEPKKLVEQILKKEFIDFRDLLPSLFGTPEPTVFDLFEISKNTYCQFRNTFPTITHMREPECMADLLTYCSIIIKVSMDYDDMPWLHYDTHLRSIIISQIEGFVAGRNHTPNGTISLDTQQCGNPLQNGFCT